MNWLLVVVAVARRPSLWRTAVTQIGRTARPGWYRRAPFVPVPPREYVAFRLVTQYGDAEHHVEPCDVLNYLLWCKQWDSNR